MVKFPSTPNRCITVDGEEVWISRSVTVLAVLVVIYDGAAYVPLNKRGPDLPSEVGKPGVTSTMTKPSAVPLCVKCGKSWA